MSKLVYCILYTVYRERYYKFILELLVKDAKLKLDSSEIV